MIEPLSSGTSCHACGTPLPESSLQSARFCPFCGAARDGGSPPAEVQLYPPPAEQYPLMPVVQAPALDPDRPRWGVWTGIGVLVFSVAALLVAQVAVVMVLLVIDKQRGVLPPVIDGEALRAWAMSSHVVTASVYSTIPAHLLTILFCWAVVTRLRKQPFFASLGWNWAGHSPLYWLGIAALIFIGILLADNLIFNRFLPQKKTPFDDLLATGTQVRIAIAILASFSAPLVEEIVYRGVIFGALRKYLSATTTIIIVTLVFTGVHVLQYFGAWATVATLMLLSLVLTVVRARSKTLLPCIVIHFINNAVASLMIVFGKDSV